MSGRLPQTAEIAGDTDVGLFRTHNEDAFGIDEELGLLLVADGMGGHVGGDIASRTAVQAVIEFIRNFDRLGASSPDARVVAVRNAVSYANRRIVTLNQQRGLPDGRGMGTTLVGLWFPEGLGRAVIFHAGDSRLYRLRDGVLTQLTRDHSLYQVWLDAGGIGEPPNRNVIMRALGMDLSLESEVGTATAMAGDIYLLCSDGLNGMVSDADIARVLSRTDEQGPAEICRQLIGLANDNGGRDNITVVLTKLR